MSLIGQFVSRLRGRPVGELKEAIRQHTGDTALLFLTDSMSAFGRGDMKSAMKHVTAGLHENPDHPRLLLFRGLIFFQDGRYKEAAEAFRQTLRVDPDCKDARDMLQSRELSAY